MSKPLVLIQRKEELWTVEVDGQTLYEGGMRAAVSAASKCSRIHNLAVSVSSSCWRDLAQYYVERQNGSPDSVSEASFRRLKQLA